MLKSNREFRSNVQYAVYDPKVQYRAIGGSLLYKMGGTVLVSEKLVSYMLMILGVVTYVLVVARTGTPTVPTALGVPY